MRHHLANGVLGAAFVGGLLLVAAGAALVDRSAGLIVAGALLTAGAFVYERGRQP